MTDPTESGDGPCPVCGSTEASREKNNPFANLRDDAAIVTGLIANRHPEGEAVVAAILAGEALGQVTVASSKEILVSRARRGDSAPLPLALVGPDDEITILEPPPE